VSQLELECVVARSPRTGAPLGVHLPAGPTLRWENIGASIHTATDSRQAWYSRDIGERQVKSIEFDPTWVYTNNCVRIRGSSYG
jgi:hypothetical protein